MYIHLMKQTFVNLGIQVKSNTFITYEGIHVNENDMKHLISNDIYIYIQYIEISTFNCDLM